MEGRANRARGWRPLRDHERRRRPSLRHHQDQNASPARVRDEEHVPVVHRHGPIPGRPRALQGMPPAPLRLGDISLGPVRRVRGDVHVHEQPFREVRATGDARLASEGYRGRCRSVYSKSYNRDPFGIR